MFLKYGLDVTKGYGKWYDLKPLVRFRIHSNYSPVFIICEIKLDIGQKISYAVASEAPVIGVGVGILPLCHTVKTKSSIQKVAIYTC